MPADDAIPGAPEPLPDVIDYLLENRRLTIGKGFIDYVTPEVWTYEVSGKQVLRQWFSYRKQDRSRPIIGDRRPPLPLDKIQPDHWLSEYTTDLMNLLHVLGRLVRLEPSQADLLQRILNKPLLSLDADTMPWDGKKRAYHQLLFPQMTRSLPIQEAETLRAAFDAEWERLTAA